MGLDCYWTQQGRVEAVMADGDSYRECRGFNACLKCTQNCYRSHGNGNVSIARPSYFFKVMLGDYATVLRIPPAFVEQLRYQILQNAYLEGPSGQTWLVTLCCTSSGMSFEHGWQTFVSDHSLDFGDFLVFKYVGKSHFIVQIFGRSGCEKRDAFSVKKNGECHWNEGNKQQQENRTENTGIFYCPGRKSCIDVAEKRYEYASVQNLRKIPNATDIKQTIMQMDNTGKIKPRISVGQRPMCFSNDPMSKHAADCAEDSMKVDFATNHVVAETDAVFPAQQPMIFEAERVSVVQGLAADYFKQSVAEACGSPSSCRAVQPVKKMKLTQQQKVQSTKDGGKQYVSMHYSSCRRPVTKAEREKALEAAKSFMSNKPFTLITMKQSQVYQGFWLSLTMGFTKRWLPDKRIQLNLLGPAEKKWPVWYLGDRSNSGLSGGWKRFALDNNLEEGDVCIFELENDKDYTLQVHIFRVVENCIPPKRVEGTKLNAKHGESAKKSATITSHFKTTKGIANSKKLQNTFEPVPSSVDRTVASQQKSSLGFEALSDGMINMTVPKIET